VSWGALIFGLALLALVARVTRIEQRHADDYRPLSPDERKAAWKLRLARHQADNRVREAETEEARRLQALRVATIVDLRAARSARRTASFS